jgi:hypothetical protein
MPTPKIAIRMPRQLILEMRGQAHRESLKRGRTITWVTLLHEAAERYLRRASVGEEHR